MFRQRLTVRLQRLLGHLFPGELLNTLEAFLAESLGQFRISHDALDGSS
jgi:predicted DNA-binding protein with PD1-like motif